MGHQALRRLGWCEADSILFDCAAAFACRRTVSGKLETASPPLGLKVEDEEGCQDVLGHRPEVALGGDGEFVGGYHGLGSGIEVAGNIAAIVALEGLQAYVNEG